MIGSKVVAVQEVLWKVSNTGGLTILLDLRAEYKPLHL